jgi:hypothetical protein
MRQASAAVRAERDAWASAEPILFHLSICGSFADTEELCGSKDTAFGHLESFLERRFFQIMEVEGFWQHQ